MIRKVHSKCMMKGCSCRSSYHISLSREMGNSIIICKNCAKRAIEMIDEYEKAHAAISSEPTEPQDDEQSAENQSELQTAEWVCEECGKVCTSKQGLSAHMRSHNRGEQ